MMNDWRIFFLGKLLSYYTKQKKFYESWGAFALKSITHLSQEKNINITKHNDLKNRIKRYCENYNPDAEKTN